MKILIFCFLAMFAVSSCSDDDPASPDGCVDFEVIYASTTRIVLLAIPDEPGQLEIRRGETVLVHTAADPDGITVVDSGIVPGREYEYQYAHTTASATCRGEFVARSMDTTQHPVGILFVDSLGGATSSVNDLVVFNDEDIWVTGYFWPSETHGIDSLYKVAHWDGVQWEYMNIPHYANEGTLLERTGADEMILRTNGLHLYRDEAWHTLQIPAGMDFPARAVCKVGENRYHFVGDRGLWAIWNGNPDTPEITKYTLPARIDFLDCHTNGKKVMAVARDQSGQNHHVYTLDLAGTTASEPYLEYSESNWLTSIWLDPVSDAYSIPGRLPAIMTPYEEIVSPQQPPYPVYKKVYGTSIANIYWYGGPDILLHYNGSTFRSYTMQLSFGRLNALEIHDDVLYGAGSVQLNGIARRGMLVRIR